MLPFTIIFYSVTPYTADQGVFHVFCLAVALSLVSVGDRMGQASLHGRFLAWFPHVLIIAALFPDFSSALNTWTGAMELLQGLCHCHDGSGPGLWL